MESYLDSGRASAASLAVRSTPESTISTAISSADNMALTVQFSTVKKLFQEICDAPGDSLVVQDVSPEDFISIQEARDCSGIRFKGIRFRRFLATKKLLIITIPTTIHESLHGSLYIEIWKDIQRQGLDDEWRITGAATYPGGDPPNRDRGEGDSSGCPTSRPVRGHWPTLVIEGGYSQTLQALRETMRWWFHASNHQVKIVLLAKMDVAGRRIILEKYQEVPTQSRQGATTTRAAASLEPHLNQVITIVRTAEDALNPESHTVTRGALRLGFQDLFLRLPGPREQDFIVGIQRLKMYAVRVWEMVLGTE